MSKNPDNGSWTATGGQWRARLILLLLKVVGVLPLRFLHAMGSLMAAIAWRSNSRSVRIARRNLAMCFPELDATQRERLLRDTLRHSACTLCELPAIWTASPRRIAAMVREVRGLELAETAAARGKGILMLPPHLGCWELLNVYFAQRFQVTLLYRPPRLQWLEPVLRHARGRVKATQVRAESNAIRGLFRAMHAGHMVGILPDQEPKQGEGRFAPFFGIDALTMVLPSRLIERTNCTPLMVFAERLPRGQGFRIHIMPPPQPLAIGDTDADAAALNAAVEHCVRMAPAQYQWIYKRFNIRHQAEDRGMLYRDLT